MQVTFHTRPSQELEYGNSPTWSLSTGYGRCPLDGDRLSALADSLGGVPAARDWQYSAVYNGDCCSPYDSHKSSPLTLGLTSVFQSPFPPNFLPFLPTQVNLSCSCPLPSSLLGYSSFSYWFINILCILKEFVPYFHLCWSYFFPVLVS